MWRTLRALMLALTLAALAALLLAGCASQSPTQPGANATATHTPTQVPTPTPLPTVATSQVAAACGFTGGGFNSTPFYQVGDLYINVQLNGLDYPSRKLPDGTPLQPLQLNATSDPGLSQQIPLQPLVNPDLSTGFVITLCDAGSTAHTIQSVTARIDSFTAFSGALNSWQLCDGYYSQGAPMGGGCGGAFLANEYLNATFSASAEAGATTPAAFVKAGSDNNGNPYPALPTALQPGQSMSISVAMTAPTVAGTYLFSFSVTADGVMSAFVPTTDPVLLDSAARKWSGPACSAYASQIPANSSADYICPEAA